MGWVGYHNGKTAIENLTFNQLTSIRATKSSQMQGYLDLVQSQIVTLGENQMTINAMKNLSMSFSKLGATPGQSELKESLIAADSSLQSYYANQFIPS